MKSTEVINKLEKAGWVKLKKRGKGSHTIMKHPDKKKLTNIPHGTIKPGTLRQIERVTGERLRKGA